MTDYEQWLVGFIAGIEQNQKDLREHITKSHKQRRHSKMLSYAIIGFDVAWVIVHVITGSWGAALLMLALALYVVWIERDSVKQHREHVAEMGEIDAGYDVMIAKAQTRSL